MRFTKIFRSITIILILSINPLLSSSQVTIGTINQTETSEALKPIAYDSLKNFSDVDNECDYRMLIGQKLFIPPIEGTLSRPWLFNLRTAAVKTTLSPNNELLSYVYKPIVLVNERIKLSNNSSIGNSYYTVIDVFCADSSKMYITNKINSKLNTAKTNNLSTDFQELKLGTNNYTFILEDDKSGDTLFTYGWIDNNFIITSYFEKQKQLFDGKTFVALNDGNFPGEATNVSTKEKFVIPHLSKWICEVNLLNIERNGERITHYEMYYIFKNDNNQTVLLSELNENQFGYSFMLEEEFINEEREKKLSKEKLLAEQRQRIELINEQQAIEDKLKETKCIKLYGLTNGKLIAEGKVALGMTIEMCLESWGKPFKQNKTTEHNKTMSHLYYGWGKSLHFINNQLVRIEE